MLKHGKHYSPHSPSGSGTYAPPVEWLAMCINVLTMLYCCVMGTHGLPHWRTVHKAIQWLSRPQSTLLMLILIALHAEASGAEHGLVRCGWAVRPLNPEGDNLQPHAADAAMTVTNLIDRGRTRLSWQPDTRQCGNNTVPPRRVTIDVGDVACMQSVHNMHSGATTHWHQHWDKRSSGNLCICIDTQNTLGQLAADYDEHLTLRSTDVGMSLVRHGKMFQVHPGDVALNVAVAATNLTDRGRTKPSWQPDNRQCENNNVSSRLVTIEVSDVLDHKLPLKSLHAQLHKSAPGYATRFDSHTDVSFSTKHLVVQVFTSVLYWVISYSHLPCWTRWSSWNRYTYRSKDITLPMFMIGLVTLPTGLLGAPGTSDRCDWAIKIFSPDGENLLPHVAAAYREVTSMMDRGRAKLMRQLDTTHCGNNSAPPSGC